MVFAPVRADRKFCLSYPRLRKAVSRCLQYHKKSSQLRIKEVFKAILLTIVYVFISEAVSIWLLIPYYFKSYFEITRFLPIISTSILLPIIYFLTKKRTKDFLNFKFENSKFWILTAIIFGITFIFVQYPLMKFFNLFITNGYDIKYRFDGYKEFKNIYALNIIASVILGPLAEELFFRGLIQNNLQKKFKPVYAIMITSLLFALMHIKFENYFFEEQIYYQQSYLVFFGSLFLGIIFYKSKSLIPPILAHMIWNLMIALN